MSSIGGMNIFQRAIKIAMDQKPKTVASLKKGVEGKSSSSKWIAKPIQAAIRHVEEKEKKPKKKKTEDLKINGKKPQPSKSGQGTNYSGPGDTNL